MTKGVHIQVSTITMAQGARETVPSMLKDEAGMPAVKPTVKAKGKETVGV